MAALADKIILVSGGTQGVGAGIARAAVREGATVVVTGRRPEVGEAFVAELTADGRRGVVRPGRRGRHPVPHRRAWPR